ncbi:MAG: glutamate-cysteine ligase family protein [Candidatus Thorarchaeota archaeon]
MLFHLKTKDLDIDPFMDYQVLCGIEEEFLIINKNGNLKEVADDLMVKSAEILEKDPQFLNSLQVKIRGLDAEPSPSQIEYVTLPLPPASLEEAVIFGRKLLTDAAKKIGVKILSSSLHPLQSDPHPIAGTHINVSVQRRGSLMTPEEMKAVYNYLWNYLPELIAISANSPIYRGYANNISSNRCSNSTVLKRNGFAVLEVPKNQPALIPMRYYGRMRYKLKIGFEKDEFSKKVITNNRGDRLVDICPRGPFTNISDDKDELPSRNRVEVRIIDVQENIEDLLDLTYLCCVSALHAIYLQLNGEITQDVYHNVNIENAIANGHATFLQRENGKPESIKSSVSRWLNETQKYQKYLGIRIVNLPIQKLQTELIQKNLDIEYQSRKIEKLRQQGRSYAVLELTRARIVTDRNRNQYKIKSGAQIRGEIVADYKLSYNEKNGIVPSFNSIRIVNYLVVQNLKIPLYEDDRVLRVRSESESLVDRLFGSFF